MRVIEPKGKVLCVCVITLQGCHGVGTTILQGGGGVKGVCERIGLWKGRKIQPAIAKVANILT